MSTSNQSKQTLLTKSRLMHSMRCPKCVYLSVHHPTLATPISQSTQALLDQGNEIGIIARTFYPNGVLVENPAGDISSALAKTQEFITNGISTLYEAAFEYNGCYARADIIQFNYETKYWRIFEVKSSTKVKSEHLDDVGLQAWIMSNSGLSIEQINIVHINTDCRYPDLSNLFTTVDVTEQVLERFADISSQVEKTISIIAQPDTPKIDIGSYCEKPTDCAFKQHCWQHIPDISIFNLPRIGQNKWKFYNQGIILLDDPQLSGLNNLHERIVTCYKTGERYINTILIKATLSKWKFPLIFLDFETISPAIPRYNGSRPYEQIPFQFSVHIWENPNASITHKEFLHDTTDDPRVPLIKSLLEACGTEGTIIAFNSSFEAQRIADLANYASTHRLALENLITRLVDPQPLMRDAVYDNTFAGSFSLKSVAPALLGKEHSYEGMMVSKGDEAQRAFEEMIAADTSTPRKQQLRTAMLEYCQKDTWVMVELVKWLFHISHETQ